MDDESSVMMDPMMDFWGVELSGKCKTVTWPGSDEELEPDVTVRLELRQACLGPGAKNGERNVVELTTEDESGEKATHSVVSLRVGGTEQAPLYLEVFPPVTFHLAAGLGPLHIVGNVYTELGELPSDDEEEDDSSNDEVVAGRKRPVDSPPKKLAKTRKIVKENGGGRAASIEQKGMKEEEEDDEEESDEEEDESEEESEQEKEHKPPQKPALVAKPKVKSAQKSSKPPGLSKTPQPPKGSKSSGKTTFSAPNTPEQSKSAKKGSKHPMRMEDMKEKLNKTPNLPKKLDKFNNYIQQNFKVTDDKVKKQLWEFAQKVRTAK